MEKEKRNRINIQKRKNISGKNNQAKIFLFCYLKGEPVSLSDIAHGTDLDRQLVAYHLPKLVDDGVILKYEKEYMANPVFFDQKVWDTYYGLMTEFVEAMADKIVFPPGCDREEAVHSILKIFPVLFSYQVEEMEDTRVDKNFFDKK